MLKHLGRTTACAGFLIACWLISREHPASVLTLLRTAGFGLVFASFAHILAMLANGRDWQSLVDGDMRPSLARMVKLAWIRESVNSMLPVARVGGELVSFRLLRKWGVGASPAVTSIVVDMQLTVISQLLFTMVGIAFLFAHADSATSRLARDLAWGVVVLTPLLILFAMVQRVSPFERITRLFSRMTSGKFAAQVGESVRIDESIRRVWRQKGVVLRYLFVWQPLQCLALSLEIWLALYFLHSPVSFTEAVVIESLIQALSSAAFFVPGGLGVQEGGFVMIGGALGLDPVTCLALAGARRIRDLLIFVPGLIAWQLAEASSSVFGAFRKGDFHAEASSPKTRTE